MSTAPPPAGLHFSCHETRQSLLERYRQVRAFSQRLSEPLVTEDFVVQSMPDASPTKWHLGHTTWFFETFVLAAGQTGYRTVDPHYAYLFNSYYVQAGERYPRPRRGVITRPTVREVFDYRSRVDQAMAGFLEACSDGVLERLAPVVETGIHHEQQHQELLLTDIKHLFSFNPAFPVYRPRRSRPAGECGPLGWVQFEGGLCRIGHDGEGFCYDNEMPRHRCYLEPFHLADRLVTNGEFLQFMEDGGYTDPLLWLSDGFAARGERNWEAPLYWRRLEGEWHSFTLNGLQPLDPAEPVAHLSYYEADAYARWAGARLPTETEWEVSAGSSPVEGHFVESGEYHPRPARAAQSGGLSQLWGDLWEWTSSDYGPYPGYRPAAGPLGEYNGKFMSGQRVLRGGSCATSKTHMRATYRNFFPPEARWQFTGLRLAR